VVVVVVGEVVVSSNVRHTARRQAAALSRCWAASRLPWTPGGGGYVSAGDRVEGRGGGGAPRPLGVQCNLPLLHKDLIV
jgi:hypothetical protein